MIWADEAHLLLPARWEMPEKAGAFGFTTVSSSKEAFDQMLHRVGHPAERVKPRIRWSPSVRRWFCTCDDRCRSGLTPEQAYHRWETLT